MSNFNRFVSNAKHQQYGGRSYQSRAEAGYAAFLDNQYYIGEIKSWKPQKRVELFGENGTKVCDYIVDFEVIHNNGLIEYVEVKGFETDIWRLKWKLFKDKYGKNAKYKITLVRV